ncbi:MAG: hypothetical protein UW97_C0033G0008 [Parcubacteria group bacterium GW2011_GWA2_45_15]|nr:MAG: hypothetical protein UW97_C0033G0008 [Parcubacteria group bacterium GW2011_GWA2_45_15]
MLTARCPCGEEGTCQDLLEHLLDVKDGVHRLISSEDDGSISNEEVRKLREHNADDD